MPIHSTVFLDYLYYTFVQTTNNNLRVNELIIKREGIKLD